MNLKLHNLTYTTVRGENRGETGSLETAPTAN